MPSDSVEKSKNDDEKKVHLRNENLVKIPEDYLYHLGMGTASHDLKKMFGDVKFICMGGTAQRMHEFANYIMGEIGYELPVGTKLLDLTENAHRYSMYKVGPVISVNHGMGMPSLSILLHEMFKLVHYAGCVDPIFIRIGTCGGVGVQPGTVIVSNEALNGLLENEHEFIILGKRVKRPTLFDQNLAKEIQSCSQPEDDFKTVLGKTIATDDFYEGQGRTDGAICEHTEEQKFEFLKKIHSLGVRNFEMEATALAALSHYTGIKAAEACVAFLDRLKGDQVSTPKEQLVKWTQRPQVIVGRFIKNRLNKK